MIPDDVLRHIEGHARSTYPAECCGLLLADAAGALRFEAIANVAGSPQGTATSAPTQRDGHVMDPKALLATLDATERPVSRPWGIVHSHPGVGAYFSSEDRNMAFSGRQHALWPSVRYV